MIYPIYLSDVCTLHNIFFNLLTDVPPQPNSVPDVFSRVCRPNKDSSDQNPPPARAIELHLTE